MLYYNENDDEDAYVTFHLANAFIQIYLQLCYIRTP